MLELFKTKNTPSSYPSIKWSFGSSPCLTFVSSTISRIFDGVGRFQVWPGTRFLMTKLACCAKSIRHPPMRDTSYWLSVSGSWSLIMLLYSFLDCEYTRLDQRCWPCRWLYANMSAQLGIQSGLMMASFVTKSLTPSCMSNSVSKAK